MQVFRNVIADKEGATAIEYGLIAALISVAAIAAMTALGGQLKNTFNMVSNSLENGQTSGQGN